MHYSDILVVHIPIVSPNLRKIADHKVQYRLYWHFSSLHVSLVLSPAFASMGHIPSPPDCLDWRMRRQTKRNQRRPPSKTHFVVLQSTEHHANLGRGGISRCKVQGMKRCFAIWCRRQRVTWPVTAADALILWESMVAFLYWHKQSWRKSRLAASAEHKCYHRLTRMLPLSLFDKHRL